MKYNILITILTLLCILFLIIIIMPKKSIVYSLTASPSAALSISPTPEDFRYGNISSIGNIFDNLSTKTKGSFSLFFYIAISFIYVMIMHFAVGMRGEFNLYRFSGIFVITGILGWIINSFETGFILGIIISLIFWQSE